MNLLTNGGFEGGWTRRTWTGQEFGEIFVPEGWVAFWKEGGPVPHDQANAVGYGRPEMQVIRKEPPFLDPPRVGAGAQGLKYFSFWRIHDAGVYQRVSGIKPGSILRLVASYHAWYSQGDNPYLSEYVSETNDLVPLRAGDPGMEALLGIDPTGGTDPYAASVIWSEPVRAYDRFQRPAFEVEAKSETVTVFLRSRCLYPFKHCDAYWDDAVLEVVQEPLPEPEPEPQPDPWRHPGDPREEYVRVVNVVPQTATRARFLEIAGIAWDRGRQTVSGSYDDAGIGNLVNKTAVLWDSPTEERQVYRDWYAKWYPGTKVAFDGIGTSLPDLPCNEPAPYRLRSGNLIGLHSSYWGALTLDYLTKAKPTCQKFFSAGDAYRAGKIDPLLIVVWRKHLDGAAVPSDPKAGAQWWLDQYSKELDIAAAALGVSVYDLTAAISAIESQNEVIGTFTGDAIKRAVEFDVRFAEAVYARYGGALRAVLLNVAVGNPHETEVELLLPAAQATEKYGGYLGYHAYWTGNEQESFLVRNWKQHAGRWTEWDKVFTEKGCYPRYLATEGGLVYAKDGWTMNGGGGWRMCGWPFSEYLKDIAAYNSLVRGWNAEHANRCAGITLFCAYQWQWDSFLLRDAEIKALMEWANAL